MKLIISLTLSLILALLPVFAAASVCCCADGLMQQRSQHLASGELQQEAAPSCHDMEQQSSDHTHVKCQCDHQATSSLPSITAANTSFQLEAAIVLVSTNPPLLSHNLDKLYRPPIFA